MDTITLIRSAIRGLLKVADTELRTELRGVLSSGDDDASSAKPAIDWDDKEAQAQLIDPRAKDADAGLARLDGTELDDEVNEAMTLLATVVGQDLEEVDGTLHRAKGRQRPGDLHGRPRGPSRSRPRRSFDGFKGHVTIDPDSEIITKTVDRAQRR